MAKEINFDSFNKAVDTPVFVKEGVRYQTKPITVKSAAKFIASAKEIGNDPEKLPEFVTEFTRLIGVPEDLFDDMDFETFMEVLNSFFTKTDPTTDNK